MFSFAAYYFNKASKILEVTFYNEDCFTTMTCATKKRYAMKVSPPELTFLLQLWHFL